MWRAVYTVEAVPSARSSASYVERPSRPALKRNKRTRMTVMRTQLSLLLDSAHRQGTGGGRRKIYPVCPLHNLRETLLHPDVIVGPRPLHLGFHILPSKVASNKPFLYRLCTNFVDHAPWEKYTKVIAKFVPWAPGKGTYICMFC